MGSRNNSIAECVVAVSTEERGSESDVATVSATFVMKALSLRFPRCGTGAKYGESVSSSMRSIVISGRTSRRVVFLNVTTPPMPKYG